MSIVVNVRCVAFPGEEARSYRVRVFGPSGAVKVYDPIAGHFTSEHVMPEAAIARARRKAGAA